MHVVTVTLKKEKLSYFHAQKKNGSFGDVLEGGATSDVTNLKYHKVRSRGLNIHTALEIKLKTVC